MANLKINLRLITINWLKSREYSHLYQQKNSLQSQKWKNIEISNLHFKHDVETDAHDLFDVYLNLKKGEKIALIGQSGSGKSTLMRVVRGLFVPEKIGVLFDKNSSSRASNSKIITRKNTKNYDWIKQHTTLIPQDPEIFENTIRFNITLGVTVSDAEIDEVVRLSRFDSVLKRLPDGYDTDIRERGVNLSGGEKQRLALARGLLAAKQSEIILLDAPTSSVDMVNEKAIFTDLFAAWPDKTFIVSVHRKYLLDMFDSVYEMADGSIIHSTISS